MRAHQAGANTAQDSAFVQGVPAAAIHDVPYTNLLRTIRFSNAQRCLSSLRMPAILGPFGHVMAQVIDYTFACINMARTFKA